VRLSAYAVHAVNAYAPSFAMTSLNPVAPLRLLLVALSDEESDMIQLDLKKMGQICLSVRVTTASELKHQLKAQTWDAMLCALRHPGLTARVALRIMRDAALDLPCIVIANDPGDKTLTRIMQAGAHECFTHGHYDRLLPTIEREMHHARQRADHRAALEMLRESEARFRALAANLPGMVFQLQYEPESGLRFTYVSEGCYKLIGIKHHELLTAPRCFLDAVDISDRESLEKALEDSATTCSTLNWEGRFRKRGQVRWVNLRSTPQRLGNGSIQWQGIATDISRSKEAEAQLLHSREQLSELSYHLEAAKEEERERIARDIHDELGSILVAIKIETALLSAKLPEEPHGLHDKAKTIEGMLDRAMGTASQVARELRPGILKEFGLSAAIECQAEDFSQRTGIICRVQCNEDVLPLDESASLALFRIFQETLTNVAKHARASLVSVRLHHERNIIILEIRDNGRGISEADLNKPRSFGLRGIRERINSLGGEFSIGSVEQGGSHIILSVPVMRRVELASPIEESAQQNLF